MPSRRNLLLAQMKTILEAATPPGGTRFGRVLFEDYEGREKQGQSVLSILEGPEVYIDVVAPDKRDRALDLELKVWAYIAKGVDLREGANEVLADLEDVVEENSKWGGYAYSTSFQSNVKNVEDTGDRTVEISLFVTVRYRTKRSDPRVGADV